MRTLYGLDRAIAPYEIDGKLIFLGNRAGRSFVVYDGRQVGADWPGHLSLALCCEGVLYNPRYGGGRYLFWGGQDGAAVCVETVARERTAPPGDVDSEALRTRLGLPFTADNEP